MVVKALPLGCCQTGMRGHIAKTETDEGLPVSRGTVLPNS